MKLISTLRNRETQEETIQTLSDDCTIGQALTLIENWCHDSNANYPSIESLYKIYDYIRVDVRTKDGKYVNFFEIKNK